MTPPLIKAIPTEYKGLQFRSKLEARWAMFFDLCGAKWGYEPVGFDLGGGLKYLPDFLIHDIRGRGEGKLWVEVKGFLDRIDQRKIRRFSERHPIIVLGDIPTCPVKDAEWVKDDAWFFNFCLVDGDQWPALPAALQDGGLGLMDSNECWCDGPLFDLESTESFYDQVRNAFRWEPNMN